MRGAPAQLLPRLSTLAKLYAADMWVILDDVQFSRRDYQHRCHLPAAGAALAARWLTVPVHLPAGRATLIRDARIADPALAVRRVRGLLRQYFRTSPHRTSTTAVSATAYLYGTGGSRYLDPASFTAQGLAVQFFTPPSRLASLPPDACHGATALAEAGPQALAGTWTATWPPG